MTDFLFGLMIFATKYAIEDHLSIKETYLSLFKLLKTKFLYIIQSSIIRGTLMFCIYGSLQFSESQIKFVFLSSPIALFFFIKYYNAYTVIIFESNKNPISRSQELNKYQSNNVFAFYLIDCFIYFFVFLLINIIYHRVFNFPETNLYLYIAVTLSLLFGNPIVILFTIEIFKYLKKYQVYTNKSFME